MEQFLVHSNIRNDERFLQLDPDGRLLYLLMPVAFDSNHGHAEYNPVSIVAQAFPQEQRMAATGDSAAAKFIARLHTQLSLMVEIGLCMLEETRCGPIIALAQWERYTGKYRTKRGCPKFAMGPRIAATRDWSKTASSSHVTTLEWAEDNGIREIVECLMARTPTSPRTPPEQFQNTTRTSQELFCSVPLPVPGPDPEPKGGGSAVANATGATDTETRTPDTTTTFPLRGEEPSQDQPGTPATELPSAFVTVDCKHPDAVAQEYASTVNDLLRLAEYAAARSRQQPKLAAPALYWSMLRKGERPPSEFVPESERQRLAAETAAQLQAAEQQSDAERDRAAIETRLRARGVSQADHERWQACREAAVTQGILPRGLSAMVDVRWVGINGQMTAELVTSRLSAPRVEAAMDAFRQAVALADVSVAEVRVVQHDPGMVRTEGHAA